MDCKNSILGLLKFLEGKSYIQSGFDPLAYSLDPQATAPQLPTHPDMAHTVSNLSGTKITIYF